MRAMIVGAVALVVLLSLGSVRVEALPVVRPPTPTPMPIAPRPVPVPMPMPAPAPMPAPPPAPAPAPSPVAPAPVAAPPPSLDGTCKSLRDCTEEATQCLAAKLVERSDQSTDQRYFIEYGENGVPRIVRYVSDIPSEQNNAEASDCGLELEACLRQRC